MFLRSREELRSYEAIRAHSVQEMLSTKKHMETRRSGLSRKLLNLPFEPVWYVPMMVASALLILLLLFESAPYDLNISSKFKIIMYSIDMLYGVDVIIMAICKFVKLKSAPILRPTARPKIILLCEFLSIYPIELAVSESNSLYRLLKLNRVLRITRLMHHLYYKHSMVQFNLLLKVVMFFYLLCVVIFTYYTCAYHLHCYFGACSHEWNYATSLFLSCAALITNHGLAESPRARLMWPLTSSIMGYFSFYAIFGVCLAYIINDFTRSQSHKYKFKNNITNMYKNFHNMNLPKEIADVCIDFYHIFWRNRNGFNDDTSFFKMLPFPMYQQVVLDVCWVPLKHSKLLKNMDQPFLRFLSMFVQQKFMLKGQFIYQKNHLKKKMVYIANGK